MYPTKVPHFEKFCTSDVPHQELFVPHSEPYEMATLAILLVECISLSNILTRVRLRFVFYFIF